MARYELVDQASSKFWEIALDGAGFTVRFGRIGTDGQSQIKTFPSAAAALAEHDKLVREKVKKGYAPTGAAAATAPAAAPTAPAPALATRNAPGPAPGPAAPTAPPPAAEPGWIDAGDGYALGIRDERIVARNAKGRILGSVPKDLRDGDAYVQLVDALELLEHHAAECRDTVELWMLRSLPVPRAVLAAVWPDEAWRRLLENAVVTTDTHAGVLRGVDVQKGLGVVTLDGDTTWLAADTVRIPHPILLDELDDWRALLAEVGLTQGLQQLFRETFARSTGKDDDTSVDEWSGAEFALLAQAMGEARKGGWRVRGGAACCATWEGGRIVEARYDLGEGDPMYETTTGSLFWVDPDGATLRLADVGPVAWSEGMRMAAAIHRKRQVEERTDGADA
jgi:predicted DNA-binding WGR domain protein